MRYQEIQLDLSKLCLKISPKLLADISKGTIFHYKMCLFTTKNKVQVHHPKGKKTKTVPQSGKPMQVTEEKLRIISGLFNKLWINH